MDGSAKSECPIAVRLFSRVGIAGAALVFPLAAFAQDQTGPDIVVTATPLFDVGEGALRFPAQTISDEQLQRAHANDLTDYLKRLSGGVFVNEMIGRAHV